MVEALSIKKVQARDGLVIDTSAVMERYDDFDFKPRVRIENGDLVLYCAEDGTEYDRVELDAGMLEVAERDRSLHMRVKFEVKGMHGQLKTINPIIALGKGKKLPAPSWKTRLPIDFD